MFGCLHNLIQPVLISLLEFTKAFYIKFNFTSDIHVKMIFIFIKSNGEWFFNFNDLRATGLDQILF